MRSHQIVNGSIRGSKETVKEKCFNLLTDFFLKNFNLESTILQTLLTMLTDTGLRLKYRGAKEGA